MQKIPPGPYQFSNQLDIAFLNDLFEGDTEYATTVFADFLKHIPLYWGEVATAYENKNLPGLKSSVHKCKTLFGYVGHTDVLEIFQSFESKCGEVTTTDELRSDYKNLLEKQENAQVIVEKEYQRLKKYHQSS
ncbi:MAG TPA: hypothetical protein VGO09_10130 [Flavisolibacter sp.]|jgi:hypothetical protein|nr:hypothetical protein [Flavisolibacter sp.]